MLPSGHSIIAVVPYGSVVYGTIRPESDLDFNVIVHDNHYYTSMSSQKGGGTDYNFISESTFQLQLNFQEISAIETFFTEPIAGELDQFTYAVDLVALRHAVSQKSSNSWVKCKKKLTVEEGQEMIGLKSMFHAFRMVNFAIQLCKTGKIEDFTAANHYWEQIQAIGPDWDRLERMMKPQYNALLTEFRKLAPKE